MNEEIIKYTEKIKELNSGTAKYFIMTMGCQLNENDSEKMAGILETAGYEKTDKMEDADIIVFNTCCVRENAEDRLFGKLGEAKKFKENRGTIIAIGGCMMQEKQITDKLKRSYPYVDIIFGTHTLENLAKDIYEALKEKKKIEDIIDIDGEIHEGTPIVRGDKIKASVSIMNGCNNFCTYCIVPYVRGRERSRNPEDIIKEIEELAKNGYKEIMLLGQNVNSYLVAEKLKNKNLSYKVNVQGKDMEVNSFSTLLKAVDEIDGIDRIRFISPHPKDFTDDVIEAIASSKHICHLIHLPLQSGSTKVLKRMNRKYSKEEYLKLVDRIRELMPDSTFTTDIIVGFPGETEEDFKDTLDVVSKVKFEQVFMFIYSIRVGTPAEKMEDQVPEDIKHKRFDKLKALAEEQIKEKNESYVGTVQRILVEGYSKTNESVLTGRNGANVIINFKGDKSLIGKMCDVKIIGNHIWYLEGCCDKIQE